MILIPVVREAFGHARGFQNSDPHRRELAVLGRVKVA
jgi:hypothetical protein